MTTACCKFKPDKSLPLYYAAVFPWFVATAVCVWFLFVHTPATLTPRIKTLPPLVFVHLVGACSVYLACVHNTILTPSALNGAAKGWHIWVGRCGLILGVVGFVVGLILLYGTDNYDDIGFKVGLTVGGCAQMGTQFFGYQAIRQDKAVKQQLEEGDYVTDAERLELEDQQDKHLVTHLTNMVFLFVLACGIPGLMRLSEATGRSWSLGPLIAASCCIGFWMIQPVSAKLKAKRLDERGREGSEGASP